MNELGKDEPFEAAPLNPTLATFKVGKFKKCCTICDQRFISKVQLERHLNTSHVPNIPRFVCTACNETIKKSNDIKNHQLWHKLSKTPFICGLCGEQLISVYAYSKHLRDHIPETPTALLVLDRECPQCQQTFITNFLYNTHPCSVNTKRCAGCNRLQRNETEYLRHAAVCSKVYNNYSKHILAAAVAEESCVRIKNENDVEAAAAAEALARSAGTSLDMTPVVSLTRLTTPMLMNANQCVLIPRSIEDVQTSASKTVKKSNKKGVSKKDLKRVDDLLKSTMDTLVSIKHEPEIHMDTDVPLVAESVGNNDDEAMDQEISAEDDFHATDEEEEELPLDGITIKQELLDLEKDEYIKTAEYIKKETEDFPINKIPVLKLKITKEHGKLNSSLVDENAKSEKKKKKKKRKDADKGKGKVVENDGLSHDNAEIRRSMGHNEDENIVDSILMPKPGIIKIKQERFDDDPACPIHASNFNAEEHVMGLVMTTIPNEMEFQISCVSSGVEFASNTSDNINSVVDSVVDPEAEDVKPCLENLELLLQISNVSGGVDISHNELHQKVVLEQANINKNKSSAKPRKTKASVLTPSTGKALKSTSGAKRNQEKESSLPKIVAVSSADDIAIHIDLDKIAFKTERLDVGYGDVMLLNQELNNRETSFTVSSPTNNIDICHNEPEHCAGTKNLLGFNDEDAYIASLDFNNVTIKREKDFEVSEIEFNESIMNMSLVPKGLESIANLSKLLNNATTVQDNCSNVEENDLDQDDDIEEDEEEEVGEEEEEEYDEQDEEKEEEREYRELELPPILEETQMSDHSENTNIDEKPHNDHEICISQTKEATIDQCVDDHSRIDYEQNSLALAIANVESKSSSDGTASICNNFQEKNDIGKGYHDLISLHDGNCLFSSTQIKMSSASETSDFDYNKKEKCENISIEVRSEFIMSSTSDSTAVTSNMLSTESCENYSSVLEDFIKDRNPTNLNESILPETSLATTIPTINKENTFIKMNLIKESARNNSESPQGLKVNISSLKEQDVISFDMSSLPDAQKKITCSSEVVGFITESTSLKISKRNEILLNVESQDNVSSNMSTSEAKHILEDACSNVNVSLVPEDVESDFNTLNNFNKNKGIKISYQNMAAHINSPDKTSGDRIVTELTEKSLNVLAVGDQKLSCYQTLKNDTKLEMEGEIEELQTQLNHEASEQNSKAFPSPVSQGAHNLINTNSLSLIELHPYLEDISSSSSGNFDPSMLPESSTSSSCAVVSYVSAPILNEEVENLVNEVTDANNLPMDQCNLNEIAENNNNANIERELVDDNLLGIMERENEEEEENGTKFINTI